MTKNEKNSKLRVFFWLVSLPKGRYRRQAPYADVSEILGLKGPKNSQKWPEMAKNDLIRLLHSKPPQIPKNGGIAQ